MRELIKRRPLLSFVVLAYALTWLVAAPNLLAHRGLLDIPKADWLEPIAAFGPFVAALLVTASVYGRAGVMSVIDGLQHWRVGCGPFAFAALSPVVLLGVAGILVALSGRPIMAIDGSGVLGALSSGNVLDLVLISALIQALGEEPGWRGFMYAHLRRLRGPLRSALLLFPVWLLWHLPFFLSRTEFGLAQAAGFSVGILSAAIWLALIWEASRSILMAVIWHTMVNICRGIAAASSPSLFLVFSNLVLIGAVLIVFYWLVQARYRRSAVADNPPWLP